MVHTCPYNCVAVLDLANAVCVSPRPPTCNLKLEVGMGLARSFDGEFFTTPYPEHHSMFYVLWLSQPFLVIYLASGMALARYAGGGQFPAWPRIGVVTGKSFGMILIGSL
eukprot:1136885-Pelagomonas_calceolata.AAC.3